MNYTRMFFKNKSFEMYLFQSGWPTIIDFDLSLTTKSCGVDHWGLTTHMCLFGVKVFDISFVDVRHANSDSIVNLTLESFEDDMYDIYKHPETLATMGILVQGGEEINIDNVCTILNGLTVLDAKHKIMELEGIDQKTQYELMMIVDDTE